MSTSRQSVLLVNSPLFRASADGTDEDYMPSLGMGLIASATRGRGIPLDYIEFTQNLRDRNAQYGLNIQFDADGRIVLTPDTCRDVIQALLDHRLISTFSHHIYDVPDANVVV